MAWGGSEELWAGAALHLAQAGHQVQAFKTNVDGQHRRVRALREAGCPVTELDPALGLRERLANRVLPYLKQYTRRKLGERALARGLQTLRPQLTIVSQGSNYDGIAFAELCRREGWPYVLLSQKAVDFFLPLFFERTLAQRAYQHARRCFFVARHNLELTRRQLALPLPDAEVVWNPFNVSFTGELAWPAPSPDGRLRLACVARLEILDKGQDLLLEVLAQPKWKQRPLTVSLFGAGHDDQAIGEMIRYFGLEKQVSFGGHVPDISAVWRSHHALVLPSRNEGLPLALVEAMLSGRPAIAANAGGMAELLADNETGFLAAAPTAAALDEALERAWDQRANWPALGAAAAQRARATVPTNAAEQLSSTLMELART